MLGYHSSLGHIALFSCSFQEKAAKWHLVSHRACRFPSSRRVLMCNVSGGHPNHTQYRAFRNAYTSSSKSLKSASGTAAVNVIKSEKG